MLTQRLPSVAATLTASFSWRPRPPLSISTQTTFQPLVPVSFCRKISVLTFCSASQSSADVAEPTYEDKSLKRAVKLVASSTFASKKTIYSIALKKFGKLLESENRSSYNSPTL